MIHENEQNAFWAVPSMKSSLGIYQFCFFRINKKNEFTSTASLYINIFIVVGGSCIYEEMDVRVGDVFIYGISKNSISSFSTDIEFFSINISPMLLYKEFGIMPSACSERAIKLPREHVLYQLGKCILQAPQNQWVTIAETFLETLIHNQKDARKDNSFDCVGDVARSLNEKGYANINSLCESFGISRRHLQRKFVQFFGINMKDYERIIRFSKAYCEVSNTSLIDTSLKCGYYDQSHMCREFRQLAGNAPQMIVKDSLYASLKETLENLEAKKSSAQTE
jgi:AraC-like DNA-binding protein